MKKMIAVAVLLLAGSAGAEPYLRVVGTKGAPFYKSAGFDIPPRAPLDTATTINVGIVTHSTTDGSLCRYLNLGSWCVPESWVPVQASVGGSFSDQAFAGLGSSFNVAPQVGAIIFHGVGQSSSPLAKSAQAAFAGTGSTLVRIGCDFVGTVVQQGHFVPLNQAYAGRGPWDILSRAARLNIGVAW